MLSADDVEAGDRVRIRLERDDRDDARTVEGEVTHIRPGAVHVDVDDGQAEEVELGVAKGGRAIGGATVFGHREGSWQVAAFEFAD